MDDGNFVKFNKPQKAFGLFCFITEPLQWTNSH